MLQALLCQLIQLYYYTDMLTCFSYRDVWHGLPPIVTPLCTCICTMKQKSVFIFETFETKDAVNSMESIYVLYVHFKFKLLKYNCLLLCTQLNEQA